MSSKNIVLTYEGLQRLESELEFLKTEKRKDIAEKIKEALAFGDLSENSEYDEAKNEQGQVEARIAQIESMLKNAKIIDEDKIDLNTVGLGTKVRLLDLELNEEVEYTIVGSAEANLDERKISNESPVGSTLLGKAVGEEVAVTVPDGVIKFKILDIYK